MPFTLLREHAGLNRGVLLIAPVFWAAISVFLNPWYGSTGFAIHFILCAPRWKTAGMGMLIAYPLLAFWFAVRNPTLTLEAIPFHSTSHQQDGSRFWSGIVSNFPTPAKSGKGYFFFLESESGFHRVSLPEGNPPAMGATVLLLAELKPPDPPANPGQFDPRYNLRGQGAISSLKASQWSEVKPPPLWKTGLARLRIRLSETLARYVPAPALPLVAGALLNDTHGISQATQLDFQRSGMQHILAISGQHIGLLVAFLLIPALCLRLPRKLAFAAAGLLIAIYIPVTGAPVSVARAGLMLACFLPSVFLERPSQGINTFCLAAALDLLLSPFHVLNLGFQLSYAATLALILCAEPSRAVSEYCGHRLFGFIAQMIFLSAVVTIFTYPVLAASTHSFAPMSILGNLVTVPISSAMLIGGLCTWAFSPFPQLAHWAGACTGLCSVLLEGSVHFLARLQDSPHPIAEPPAVWLVVLMISALATALLFRMKRWRLGLLVIAILIAAEIFRPSLSRPFPGEARVTLLSVGHGDAAVLELSGATILIDAGPTPGVAGRVLLPFLQSRGLRRLDALLLTHPDMDHYGGAFELLSRIPIGFILAPKVRSTGGSWACLKAEAKRLHIPWKEGRAGDLIYRKGEVSLRMLGPDSSLDSASDNDQSLVCLLQTRRDKVLFTGDIEAPAQRALAGTWPLWRGAWLKAPHHGSDRTTLPCFLAAASPPVVSISSGRRPGFPGRKTVAFLEGIHAEVGVTERDGALQWDFTSGEKGTAQRRNFRMKL